jgi:hypothetical protein
MRSSPWKGSNERLWPYHRIIFLPVFSLPVARVAIFKEKVLEWQRVTDPVVPLLPCYRDARGVAVRSSRTPSPIQLEKRH